jgi:hypothetical protein
LNKIVNSLFQFKRENNLKKEIIFKMALERLYYCSIENYEKNFEDIPCKILVLGEREIIKFYLRFKFIKDIFVGDFGTGKTSIIRRYELN